MLERQLRRADAPGGMRSIFPPSYQAANRLGRQVRRGVPHRRCRRRRQSAFRVFRRSLFSFASMALIRARMLRFLLLGLLRFGALGKLTVRSRP